MSSFRVAHIIGNLGMGGTQRHLYYLAKYRSAAFADSRVLTLPMRYEREDDHYAGLLRGCGVPVENISALTSFRYAELVYGIYRLLKRYKPHVVHNWMFDFNTCGAAAAALAGSPASLATVEITTDNIEQVWWPPVNRPNRRFLEAIRLGARLADVTICNSDYLRAQYEEWTGLGGSGKVVSIPNGLDMSLFEPLDESAREAERGALGFGPGVKVVGILGRIAPEKDHGTFFKAASIVAASHPEAMFLVVGGLKDDEDSNPAPRFAETLRGLGIENRTVFTGKTYRAREMLSCMDIAVNSSVQEGSSNYLIEAQAMGLPAVATDVSGSAEIIENGRTGFIVPPKSPEAIAARVSELLSNPVAARDMGAEASRSARERYTVEKMVSATEELYMKLLREKGVRGAGEM